MANIVEITDFVGAEQVQQGKFSTKKFDPIRDEYTDPFIRQVLGATLGNLFIANFNAATPTTLDARFQVIYDAFQDDSTGYVIESKGIKFMVKAVVWFYYARTNNMNVSISGNNSQVGQNSVPLSDGIFLAQNYNKGIVTAKAIQWYIEQNSATYPEYKGQDLNYVIGL